MSAVRQDSSPDTAAELRRLSQDHGRALQGLVTGYLEAERDLSTQHEREQGKPRRLVVQDEVPRLRARMAEIRQRFDRGGSTAEDAVLSLVRLVPGSSLPELSERLGRDEDVVKPAVEGLLARNLVLEQGSEHLRQILEVESKGSYDPSKIDDWAQNGFKTTPAK